MNIKQEAGSPEAGEQLGMFGTNKVIRPRGKGIITQISMDDALKLARMQENESFSKVQHSTQ